jgi:iron complex transport system ATP-binding protein
MLKVQNLAIGYRSKKNESLIDNINFELKSGETTALIGINGAGKSTLLKTICGMTPVLHGEIYLDNFPISKLTEIEIAKKIAFVSTNFVKIKHLTAYDLTALGRFPYTGKFGILNETDRQIVEKCLQTVGISHLREKFIDQMSDGERQRLMIARALAQDTEILLLDEPASFLDLENKFLVYEILKNTAEIENKSVLYSTHDLNIALKRVDKLMLIKNNKIVAGAPEDLISVGVFDSVFNSEKIIFNKESLDFQLKSKATSEITLICENQEMKSLLTNALNRKNYFPVCESTEKKITVDEKNGDFYYLTNISGNLNEFKTIYDLIKSLPNNQK